MTLIDDVSKRVERHARKTKGKRYQTRLQRRKEKKHKRWGEGGEYQVQTAGRKSTCKVASGIVTGELVGEGKTPMPGDSGGTKHERVPVRGGGKLLNPPENSSASKKSLDS